MTNGEAAWVAKSEMLTGRFGYWPSFHDAEVRRFEIIREPQIPEEEQWGDMLIRVSLFFWELAGPDAAGRLRRQKLTLATLVFQGVGSLALEDRNQFRDINGLSIGRHERTDGPSPFYSVEFLGFTGGFGASFRCFRVMLESVEDADEHGRTLSH